MSGTSFIDAVERTLIRHGFGGRSGTAGHEFSTVVRALSAHAEAVLRENDRLHLTSIVEPAAFVTRHVEESAIGAAAVSDCLDPGIARIPRGTLIDLGSGNGYPGVPLAALLPAFRPVLVEASEKKAEFLRKLPAIPGLERIEVVNRQVQRPVDLPEGLAPIELLATRAMGNWERVLPRLGPVLANDGLLLLWAGAEAERVFDRADWRARFELRGTRSLPGRDRAKLWILVSRGPGESGHGPVNCP